MGRIDVHFHAVPQFFREAAAAAGRRPAISSGLPPWSPELALEVMDRNGIQTAITSISQPGVHFGDDEAARRLARRCNEYAAECIARWPERFGAFGILPLPDVAGACEEVRYALDVLKLDGIVLFASYGELFLGDPLFDPVLDALNERGCVVFVHPALHPSVASLRLDLPAFAIEYPFDTTRAATNLIFRGALDRFPNIRFVLAHAGGTLPYLAFRLSWSPTIDPRRLGDRTPAEVLAKLRHFWYDTALAAGPQTFGALEHVADPGKILFGSDWPYAPETVTAASVKTLDEAEYLSDDERRRIGRENALALFPRLAHTPVSR
jgi:predicted TIM-barrel fold metal-dependent hydrolase